MNKVSIGLVLGLSALLASAACKKNDEKAGEGAAAKAGGAEGAKAGGAEGAKAGAPVTLPKVDNLKVTVPAGTEVSDGVVGEGNMLQGPGITVSIEPASESFPKTLEDAKKDATETYADVKNVTEETLPDGWIMTFENKGGMGTNYWLKGLRTIDGKAYACEVTSPHAEHQKSGAAICKSLSK